MLYCLAPVLLLTAHGTAWVLFLEKAFAQLFGNYSELEAKHPYVALQCLTGEPLETPWYLLSECVPCSVRMRGSSCHFSVR
jgi:hypothetical protein